MNQKIAPGIAIPKRSIIVTIHPKRRQLLKDLHFAQKTCGSRPKIPDMLATNLLGMVTAPQQLQFVSQKTPRLRHAGQFFRDAVRA
jgi:hypothetical protein